MSGEGNEKQLVMRVVQGDHDAFEDLVHGYKGIVYGTLRRFRNLPKEDVDDLFQDVFQRLLDNNYAALRAWEGRALAAYLKRITRNAAIDALRQRGHMEPIDPTELPEVPAEPETGPGEGVLVHELRRMIDQAVRRLGDGDQAIIRMLYFEELSYLEIAERLSITTNAAGVRITRARGRLAQVISREFPALMEYL